MFHSLQGIVSMKSLNIAFQETQLLDSTKEISGTLWYYLVSALWLTAVMSQLMSFPSAPLVVNLEQFDLSPRNRDTCLLTQNQTQSKKIAIFCSSLT